MTLTTGSFVVPDGEDERANAPASRVPSDPAHAGRAVASRRPLEARRARAGDGTCRPALPLAQTPPAAPPGDRCTVRRGFHYTIRARGLPDRPVSGDQCRMSGDTAMIDHFRQQIGRAS